MHNPNHDILVKLARIERQITEIESKMMGIPVRTSANGHGRRLANWADTYTEYNHDGWRFFVVADINKLPGYKNQHTSDIGSYWPAMGCVYKKPLEPMGGAHWYWDYYVLNYNIGEASDTSSPFGYVWTKITEFKTE